MRRLQTSTLISVSSCLILVALCALGIIAQSGRHVRKPAPAPASEPTPEATPTPAPVARQSTPTVTFLVGMEKFSDNSRISLYTYSGVLHSCADRLADAGSVKADTTSSDMSRGDAVRQAKAEKETFIVLLQLRSTNSGSSSVYDDSSNVYVQYTVLAPITAKLVTSGNTFPEAYRNSRVRLPTPNSQGDYYLNQAARGAAERILDHFQLHPSKLPGPRPGP
ncbi:MAG TPA: hypothetical protein VGO68_10960 [Pyrinomonadaceae bacterium]|jgi:hypothetical protein|nr:hypothetical protein [Pyrinomonadaceae bacterium]